MVSSITGYRSPVDLQLSRVPETTDPQLFAEFNDLYKAAHLLNQYLDQLRITAEGGGGSGVLPSDSMPFNRFYTTLTYVDALAGDPLCPSAVPGQDGVIFGALASDITAERPTSNFCGICLADAAAGTQVLVGVGPAILEFPGAVSGGLIWAYSSLATNGNIFGDKGLYTFNPGPKTISGNEAYPMPVATCVRDGFVLFGPTLYRGNT